MTSRKPRRILFVSYGRPFGGAEVYTGRLSELLADHASFYALCGNIKLSTYLGRCNVHITSFRARFSKSFLWKLEYFIICIALLPYFRLRHKVDTLWIQGFREAWFLPWARLLGYTTIATMHITLERSISQTFYPYLMLFAKRVVCVSQTVADSLPTIVAKHKVAVIYNWSPAHPIGSKIATSNIRPLRLLYVGRLIRYKGAGLVLDAMHQLENEGRVGELSLTIAGEGDYRAKLEQQVGSLNVIFAGFLEETASAYLSADVFINPTLGPEGLSLVSLEAMSYGLPCILSDLSVNREITDDGHYALLFRKGDATDLSSKIKLLLDSPRALQTYAELANRVVLMRYSTEAARHKYLQLLGLC